jgi:hypothetical protein
MAATRPLGRTTIEFPQHFKVKAAFAFRFIF